MCWWTVFVPLPAASESICLLLSILIVNVSEGLILLLQDKCFLKVFAGTIWSHNLAVHFPLNDTNLSTFMRRRGVNASSSTQYEGTR